MTLLSMPGLAAANRAVRCLVILYIAVSAMLPSLAYAADVSRADPSAIAADAAAAAAPTQPDPAPPKLSLAEAVRIAVKNNPQIKQAKVSYLAAQSGVLSATDLSSTTIRAGVNQASVGGGRSEIGASVAAQLFAERPAGDELSATVVPLSSTDLTSSLQLQYSRPLIGRTGRTSSPGLRITNARFGLLSQENELFVRTQSAVEQTVSDYLGVVRHRQEIAVREADIEIAQETVRIASRKLEEGLVAEIELSRAQTQLAQSQDALVSVNRAYRDALDRLLLGMGLHVGQDTELIDSPPGAQPIPPTQDLISEALASRKEIIVSETAIKQGDLEVEVAGADLKPALAVVGSYSRQGIGVFGASENFSSQGYWTAGLDYSLPIGSTQRREARSIAVRNLAQQKVDHEFLLQQIRNEVFGAVRALDAAEASLKILNDNLKVGEDRLRLAQRMVEEGIVPNRDVLEAQVDLTRTRSGMLSAQIEYYLAFIRLQRAVGRDLTRELAG